MQPNAPFPLTVLLTRSTDAAASGLRSFVLEDPRFVIVGETTVGLVVRAQVLRPNLIVLDPFTPRGFDPQIIEALTVAVAESHVCVYTDRFELDPFLAAFEAGARGYLLKGRASKPFLLDCLSTVGQGGIAIDRAIPPFFRGTARVRVIPLPPTAETPTLSFRQRAVLEGWADGKSEDEIARELGLGVRTVRRTLRDLEERVLRTNAHTVVAKAMLFGLIRPPP